MHRSYWPATTKPPRANSAARHLEHHRTPSDIARRGHFVPPHSHRQCRHRAHLDCRPTPGRGHQSTFERRGTSAKPSATGSGSTRQGAVEGVGEASRLRKVCQWPGIRDGTRRAGRWRVERSLLHIPWDLPGSSSILGVVATDLATERGENDPNKRDRVKQAGWKDGN